MYRFVVVHFRQGCKMKYALSVIRYDEMYSKFFAWIQSEEIFVSFLTLCSCLCKVGIFWCVGSPSRQHQTCMVALPAGLVPSFAR